MNAQQALEILSTLARTSRAEPLAAAALRYAVAELAKRNAGDGIHLVSLVSASTGEPKIEIRWGDMLAHLTPAEARQHALAVLETAEAAESDAFISSFMQKTVGLNPSEAGMMLVEFRNWRAEHNVPAEKGVKG